MLMEEFNIKISVRNNLILKAIENLGYTNLNKFSKECDVSLTGLYNLVNLKEAPLTIEGEFSKTAKALMEALGSCPVELWTTEQLTMKLRNNRVERELSKESLEIALQSNARSLIGMDYAGQNLDEEVMSNIISDKIDSLTPREAKVLRMRFGIGVDKEHSLEEIASMFNMSRQNVSMIESKALRHMRHPSRSDTLKEFIDGE